jgi:two-component system response regulator NreC
MKPNTLLVVSDEAIPRAGLRQLLLAEPGLKVLDETSLDRALEKAKKLKPDVVVIHSTGERPRFNDLVRAIRETVAHTRVVVLARETNHAFLRALLAAGVSGYILLRATPRDLFAAVRAASQDRRFIDPVLSNELVDVLLQHAASGSKLLSRREQQVLRLVAYGHTLKEIATQLAVSRKSVETYLARIREKLHLQTRAEIVRYALETGVLSGRGATPRS